MRQSIVLLVALLGAVGFAGAGLGEARAEARVSVWNCSSAAKDFQTYNKGDTIQKTHYAQQKIEPGDEHPMNCATLVCKVCTGGSCAPGHHQGPVIFFGDSAALYGQPEQWKWATPPDGQCSLSLLLQ